MFDIEGTEVSVGTFLEDDNRVIFISQKEIIVEHVWSNVKFYMSVSETFIRNYIGSRCSWNFIPSLRDQVLFDKSFVRFIENYNVFHFETEPKDVVVLSKPSPEEKYSFCITL